MAQPLIADLPREVVLSGDYIIRITALSPTTGAVVAGVTVSDVVVTAQDLASGDVVTLGDAPNPLLVPAGDSV